MLAFCIAFQIAAAPAPRAMSPQDSGKLEAHVRDAEFHYLMDWRHEWESWRTDLYEYRESIYDDLMQIPAPPPVPFPAGQIDPQQVIRYDIDQHEAMAHFIRAPGRPSLSLAPFWVSPFDEQPVNEALGIDNSLSPEYRDTVRARRRPLLALLDSAAHQLPGDVWLAGQRVRMHLDQGENAAALRAATECHAAQWWCTMLRGYVLFTAHNAAGAASTFELARLVMPSKTRCAWDDVSLLLPYSARTAYQALSCAQQDSVNRRVWWLADPLYLVPTNDRRTAHYAREVLMTLDMGLDVDEREDVRDDYTGPALREMVIRYGWPTTEMWWPPPHCLAGGRAGRGRAGGGRAGGARGGAAGGVTGGRGGGRGGGGGAGRSGAGRDSGQARGGRAGGRTTLAGETGDTEDENTPRPDMCMHPVPPGWSRFDTHDGYLGLTDPWVTDSADVPYPARPRYWGPQYHTVPAWSAINDPFQSTPADWDLGPARRDTLAWDTSWWATELYQRYEGPLVELATQIGFVRRYESAAIVAAMQWAADPTIIPPPANAAVGVITSGGPNEQAHTAGAKMDGAHPRAILTPVESRPLLLGVEMVPANDSGAAARTRFGILPPSPLSALGPGAIALSDAMLLRVDPGQAPASTLKDALETMYGATQLWAPSRVGVFWEVYGQNDHDTVDVSLRIVHHGATDAVSRAAAAVGIGSVGNDSLVVAWREASMGDPLATVDHGVTIRPRSKVLDFSTLVAGDYDLSIQVTRGRTSAHSAVRTFTIVR